MLRVCFSHKHSRNIVRAHGIRSSLKQQHIVNENQMGFLLDVLRLMTQTMWQNLERNPTEILWDVLLSWWEKGCNLNQGCQ